MRIFYWWNIFEGGKKWDIYPIEQIRSQFPALKRTYNGMQAVYFDGPGGSQVVQEV
jgi:selenocysteine lyase/cysteine desulfurase